MTTLDPDDMARAEQVTQQWVDNYRGRRRAHEDGTRVLYGICADPGGHDALERRPAQERRQAPVVVAGHCTWCGGAR